MTLLPQPTTELQPRRVAFRAAVAACLAVALLSRLSFLAQPFKNDAGIYINLGKVLWQGGKPYVDFWDTKLPSVPLLMAPLWALFGNHWADYVLLQAILGILGPALLARSVGRHVNASAFAPALLCGIVGLNVSRLTLTGFQLETVQAFFELWAAAVVLWCLDERRSGGLGACFCAGLLIAAAAMPKPTGIAIGGAAALALLRQRRDVGRIAALGLGVLLPIVAVAVWVMAQPWRTEIPPLLREIRLYGSGTPWRSLLQLKTGIFFLLPFVPLVLRRLLSRGTTPPIASSPVRTFAVAWMTLELLAVLIQRRLYGYHFLVLMSPATLCFALLPVRPRLGLTLACVAPLAAISLVFALPAYRSLRTDARPMPASRYVAAHSVPTDTVWGDPAGRLLLESNRRCGSRLQMSFYLVNHDAAPREFTDLLLSDFARRRPKFIVLPVDWWAQVHQVATETPGLLWNRPRRENYLQQCHRLWDFITTQYHVVATLDGKKIYQRGAAIAPPVHG